MTNVKPDLTKFVTDLDSTDPDYGTEFNPATMIAKGDYWTDNYGGHLYPHLGSVVYAMNGGNLVFDVDASNGNAPRFTSPVRPGYVLVKEGGAIYGQGNPLRFSYVAAEKSFTTGTQYSLMSFPHDVNLEATVEVTASAGELTQTDKSSTFTPYIYDGEARAAWNYDFKDDNSELWQTDISAIQNSNSQVKGAEGWLLDFGSSGIAADATYRFTGWGATNGTDVYTESGAAKTVTLTQHDDRTSTNGAADFTKAENMGWNLKGAPLLISNYVTGGTNPDFNMNVPHVLYSTIGSSDATYGQFYTAQSWAGGATLSPGDGFFTQTAVIGGTESLSFRIPMFDGTPDAAVKEMLTLDFSDEKGHSDVIQVKAEAGADADMAYHLNSDGVKWMALDPDAPQIWLENTAGTPFSLAAHTPTEVALPIGLHTARRGRYTFSLRDAHEVELPEEVNAVWLIDLQANQTVNLMQGDYPVQLDEEAAETGRFYLQLGGHPGVEAALPQRTNGYRVYVRDRVLHVVGTQVGDRILVYTPSGALLLSDEAVNDHWRTTLQQEGIYIVHVENETHKVATK